MSHAPTEQPNLFGVTPKRTAIFFIVLGIGVALFLPTLATHTTRDNPVVLGRYGVGLTILVCGVLSSVVGLFALGGLTLVSPRTFVVLLGWATAIWKRPIVVGVLTALLLAFYAVVLSGQDVFFRRYTMRFQRGFLLGLSIVVFTLMIGLLTPWLAKSQAPPQIFASHKVRLAIIAVGSILLSGLLFGNILNLQWQWVDDGIVMNYLGPDGRVELTQVPKLLADSEIGRAFVKGRYRPSFWTLRVLEAAAWGDQPTLYYVGRFAMLVLAVALFWWVLAEWLGLLTSLLFILLSFTYVYWYDVWGRLGAAETYGVPALAIYTATLVLLWRTYDDKIHIRSWQKQSLWFVNLVAGLILIGTKENFLLALLAALALFGFILYRKRMEILPLLVTVVLLAAGLFIASSVGVALSQTGVDIYQNSVDTGGRTAILIRAVTRMLATPSVLFMLALAAGIMVASGFYVYTRGTKTMRHQYSQATAGLLLVAFLCALVYLAQIVYYNGAWPSDNRYDFPGRLVEPFLGFVFALWLIALVKIFTTDKWLINTAYLAFLFILFGVIAYRGFDQLEARIQRNVAQSQRFTANLHSIVRATQLFPDKAIIFDTHNYWDNEPAITTAIFLRNLGAQNTFHMRYEQGVSKPKAPIEKTMGEWMTGMSNNGYVWSGQELFLSLAQADPENCFSISFSGNAERACSFLVKIYP